MPGDWTRVASVDEVPEGGALAVEIGDTPVAIVRTSGEWFAVHDVCSHANVPLSEGEIEGCTLECWLHGSRFDLRTGKPSGPPATEPVPVYAVRVDGSDVYVSLSTGPDSSDSANQEPTP
ncbi:MAG TPA: non-heme iron oxygenase ferredoxin subunit [Mycobacteriales bacterium]|jgi:3-phenylpropionate/trans-cinnamate dioxygenase ferredoxin subunit